MEKKEKNKIKKRLKKDYFYIMCRYAYYQINLYNDKYIKKIVNEYKGKNKEVIISAIKKDLNYYTLQTCIYGSVNLNLLDNI